MSKVSVGDNGEEESKEEEVDEDGDDEADEGIPKKMMKGRFKQPRVMRKQWKRLEDYVNADKYLGLLEPDEEGDQGLVEKQVQACEAEESWTKQGDGTWTLMVDTLKQTEKAGDTKMKIGFEVAGVKRPLLSVMRVVEKGNRVCFGPGTRDNYIQNVDSGGKVLLRPTVKGSYMLDVNMGKRRAEIVVDSGAEENVCPLEWGKTEFGTARPTKQYTFRGAGGGTIEHYGKRDVVVTAPFRRQD
jgi:hypothetical protein